MDTTVFSKAGNIAYTPIQRLIVEFEEEIRKMSGKCIDVGCGSGAVTRDVLLPALHPKATIVGTDISEDMIECAKKSYDDEQRLKFEVMDIETKCLPEKYISEYDHAFSFHVLHWCSDIRQTLLNIYRLLRPGGTVLIMTLISHDLFDILHKLSQDMRYASYITHVNNFLPPFYNAAQPHKEMKELLKNIGFEVLHCSHRERTHTAQHASEFSPLILFYVTHFLGDMPHDLIEEFKEKFTSEYMRRRFYHKRLCKQTERIASDLHEILIIYVKKHDGTLLYNA